MADKIKYKVQVHCFTYNHKDYIIDAMDGFCIQETNFPYLCIIMDDDSTDGEQDIIRDYLNEKFDLGSPKFFYKEETDDYELIFARHRSNKNCYFAVYFLKENHYHKKSKKQYWKEDWKSTYVAMCEGDDYWNDPAKLQKQINFLDANKSFSMIFHSVDLKDEIEHSLLPWHSVRSKDYKIEEILDHHFIPTCSVVMRSAVFAEIPASLNPCDTVMWFVCMLIGKIRGMEDNMGVYRKHAGGWSVRNDNHHAIYTNYNIFKDLKKYYSNYKDYCKYKEFINYKIFIYGIDLLIKDFQKNKLTLKQLNENFVNFWRVKNRKFSYLKLIYCLKCVGHSFLKRFN